MTESLRLRFDGRDPSGPTALALLEHRAWVRSLARRLLADENAVDDVEQETWTAALRSGPDEPRALRSWLGSVASRFALQRLRGERRRARREDAVAGTPRLARPTADVVAEADAHGHVVHAVLALREPYRTTVILRYFEGLAISDVAARMEVPVETVRTRLRRAHESLRGALEREHGRPLGALLLPVCGAGASEGAAGASGGASGWLTWGGIVMATSAKTVAAATLAGAVLGVLLTLAVTQVLDDPERAGESAVVPPATPGAGPRPAASGSGAEGARPTTPARSAARSPNPPAPASTTAAAHGPADVDLPAPAAGTITGHVRTKDGDPVEGAVVRASVTRPGTQSYRRGRVPPRPSEADLATAQLAWVKWHVATLREAATDRSGAYTLRDLWDADHSLSAYAEGYDVRAVGPSSSLRAGAVADFVATRICDVPVAVVDEEGRTPAKVLVRWSLPKGGGGSSAWCVAEDPVVQIEPGTWSVHAEIDREWRSTAVAVTVAEDAPNEPLRLRLVRRDHLEGTVRWDPADAGWDYLHVTLHPAGDPGDRRDKRQGARPPDWRFRFEDIEPGEYELAASLDGITVVTTSTVRIAGGPQRHDLVVPRIPAALVLEAVVTGPNGPPRSDDELRFSLRGTAPNRSTSLGASPARRADGTYLVALRTPEDEARAMRRRAAADAAVGASGGGGGPGRDAPPPEIDYERIARESHEGLEWKLVVTWKGHGTKEVEFVPGETRRVEVRFD